MLRQTNILFRPNENCYLKTVLFESSINMACMEKLQYLRLHKLMCVEWNTSRRARHRLHHGNYWQGASWEDGGNIAMATGRRRASAKQRTTADNNWRAGIDMTCMCVWTHKTAEQAMYGHKIEKKREKKTARISSADSTVKTRNM